MDTQKLPQAVALTVAENGTEATIKIRGTIGDWWEGKTINGVEAELDWLPHGVQNLTIRITSFGGDLAQGLAINNALSRHPARKVAVIEGVAASAGTLVAMGADEVHAYANSTLMVHGVRFLDEDGNRVEMPEAERAMNESIIETYAAKTGKSRAELEAAIAQDTWMTAREALAAGFIDKVIELPGVEAPAAASTITAMACAAGIPEEVLARAQAEAAASPEDPPPASDDATSAVTTESQPSEGGDPSAVTAQAHATSAPAATFAAQVNALAVASGLGDYVEAWLLDGQITTTAQAKAAIAEASEVRDLCVFAKAEALAPGLIRGRKTLAEARAAIAATRAADCDERHTDTAPGINTAGRASAAQSGADVWARVQSSHKAQ